MSNHDVDSESDEDYIPPAEVDSDTTENARNTKRRRLSSSLEEPKEDQPKSTREALWQEFQDSISSVEPANKAHRVEPKLVKVRVTYKFAGEEVTEVKEVPEGSEDAHKWPVVETSIDGSSSATAPEKEGSTDDSPEKTVETSPIPPTNKKASRPLRRPKQSLASLAAATKPKKLSTLEKSRMDWNAHLASTSQQEVDELEKNRRTGGYLEKVDFLQRVDDRKDEARSSGKRRR
ncbi:hypothetical protein FRB99_001868 [Tulasnella sp. 403]|nr:hypothetical protein FRB99_001868 [Tulasnella sp. 403]